MQRGTNGEGASLNDDDGNDRALTDPFPESTLETFTLRGADRYTMTEAAKLKGVSYHTVSRAVRQGRLPVVRLGRMALISGEDLANWQPMRERAPRRYRHEPSSIESMSPVVLDEALGERLEIARQLSTLFEMIHAASSQLPMSEFGELLGNRFSSIFGLTRVSVWVVNLQDDSAERIATIGRSMSAIADKVAISGGYAKVFSSIELGSARVSLDPQTEFGGDATPEIPLPPGPLLIVPLRVGHRTIGGIFGDRAGEPLLLDEDQLSLAQVLGNHAAVALDNALLRKQELFRIARLSTILDQMSDHLRACDVNGRLNLINRADKVFTIGNLEGPDLGTDALDNPEVLERRELDGTVITRDRHPLARALRGEEVNDWEYEITRTDGRVQRAQVSARALVIDGEITGAVYIGRNVTSLREAERKDRERIARIERASTRAQAMAEMVMHIHTVRNIRDAVQIALDCLTRHLGDTSGIALMVQEDGGLQVAATSRAPAGLQLPVFHDPISVSTTILAFSRMTPVAVTHREAGKAEQQTMSLLNATAMLVVPIQINDEHLGAIHIVHDEECTFDDEDLTFAATVGRQCAHAIDRIRLYDKLEASRTRLFGVIDQLPQAVLIADAPDGVISIANAAVAHLWGAPVAPGTDRAESLRVLDSTGQPFPANEHPLLRVIRTGEASVDEMLTLERADRTRIDVVAHHSPVIGGDGEVVSSVSVLQDRSQFQVFDQTKVQFVAQLADELLGPVSTLHSGLHALRRNVHKRLAGVPDQSVETGFATVVEEFDRISIVVKRLLDMALADVGAFDVHPRPTDASVIIQSAVDRVMGSAPGQAIRVSAPQSIPVEWDEERVEQIVVDALDNAIRYAPEGAIDVEGLVLDSGLARIRVFDRGPGIPSRLRHRLGSRVYPFDDPARIEEGAFESHGLGLGLYLSGQVARAHGGSLTIEDAEGGGAVVTLTLPREANPKSQGPTRMPSAMPGPGHAPSDAPGTH